MPAPCPPMSVSLSNWGEVVASAQPIDYDDEDDWAVESKSAANGLTEGEGSESTGRGP